MGCDFDIKIQVRYGSQWVTVVWMYLKTPCGGYPVCDAFWQLARNEGNRGKYGAEYAETTYSSDVLYALWDAADRSCVLIEDNGPHGQNSNVKSNDSTPEQIFDALSINEECSPADAMGKPKHDASRDSQCDGDGKEDDGNEDQGEMEDVNLRFQYLYYSRDDVVKLAEVCGPTVHIFTNEKDSTHKDILAHIPAYMDQAWSALPHSEQLFDWVYGDEVKAIPKIMAMNTLARKNKLMRVLMLLFRRTVLDPYLIAIIADYALPRGEDVRLAISDDEGTAAAIRDGAPVPASTGIPPESVCCIQ